MTTTYRLHADELDPSFIERVKAAFPHQVIEIEVRPADETEDLLSDPVRRERLLRAAADVAAGRNLVTPDQTLFPVRSVIFHQDAFEQFTAWARDDRKLFERLTRLITESAREPFTGLGKPEPLRHRLQGHWSRRINEEHRLVYFVAHESITIISCRDHYR